MHVAQATVPAVKTAAVAPVPAGAIPAAGTLGAGGMADGILGELASLLSGDGPTQGQDPASIAAADAPAPATGPDLSPARLAWLAKTTGPASTGKSGKPAQPSFADALTAAVAPTPAQAAAAPVQMPAQAQPPVADNHKDDASSDITAPAPAAAAAPADPLTFLAGLAVQAQTQPQPRIQTVAATAVPATVAPPAAVAAAPGPAQPLAVAPSPTQTAAPAPAAQQVSAPPVIQQTAQAEEPDATEAPLVMAAAVPPAAPARTAQPATAAPPKAPATADPAAATPSQTEPAPQAAPVPAQPVAQPQVQAQAEQAVAAAQPAPAQAQPVQAAAVQQAQPAPLSATPTGKMTGKTVSASAIAASAPAKTAAAPAAIAAKPTSADDVSANGALPAFAASDAQPALPDAAPSLPAAPMTQAQAAPQAQTLRAGPETVQRLAVQIVQTAQGAASQFHLTLHPAELGGVQVKIQVGRDGAVTASMTFDSASAAADLGAQADDLKAALAQAGFDVADNGLSFNLSGGNRQAQDDGADGGMWGGRAFRAAAAGADDLLTAVNEAASRLQGASGDRGLDIRI